MPGVRRDGQKRRDALLDAALVCFGERGVLGTGIEEIRRAAGASPSSVYHLFAGRSAIVLALLVRTFERLFGHLTARVGKARSARGAVTSLVDAHLAWIAAHRLEGRFMYEAMSLELEPEVQEPLAARKAELLAPLVADMTRFVEQGSLPPWPPLVLDVVLLGPSHEGCRRWLAGAPLSMKWMRKIFPDLAWRSVSLSPNALGAPRTPTRTRTRTRA
ncbi:MAG: TetR/AcrR family transcriptional regulator [Labilithrix sp.]|nr:TetR/AcrR family transcriptional regulator [Labilithrix sp.]